MNMKNHLSEEQLVLHFYGDADSPAAIETHLRECAPCRARMESLKATLAMVDSAPAMQVPPRDAAYGAQVWERIAPKLGAPPRRVWWQMPLLDSFAASQRWALAGTLAALLIGAFVLGRITHTLSNGSGGSGPENVATNEQVRERILLVAVGEHIERSRMVLVELQNAPRQGVVDISSEQRRARDLVDSSRLYRQTAVSTGDQALASVLEQLERVLVEIANSPQHASSNDLEQIRRRLESQGILFKLSVVESQVKERAMPAPAPQPDAAPRSKS